MAVIYKIEHKVTKRAYIGKAQDVDRRWWEHLNNVKRGKQHPLYDAIRKYGKDAFNFEVIESVSDQEVNQREINLIKEYNAIYPAGYNLTEGGTGGNTKKGMTEDQKLQHRAQQSKNAKQQVIQGIGICAKSVKGKHITETCPEIAEKWRVNYNKGQNQKSKRYAEGNFTLAEIEGYKKLSDIRKGGNNPRAAKIMCVETGELFGSMSEAMQHFKLRSRTPIQTTIRNGKPTVGSTQLPGLSFRYIV